MMRNLLAIPRLLTEQQTAEALGVSIYTVQRERKRGHLAGRLIGNRWRYTEADIVDYIERKKACPAGGMTGPDRSEITGSAGGRIPRSGAAPGSTPPGDRLAAHRLAQQTFGKRSSG